jgi:TonB-linked SusC/RagA family outer membrane protein
MSKIILLLVALVTCCGVIAQSTITGTVVDDKNAPVPYASISIKNSKKGVTADANGNFSISANTGETLVVSAVSFTSQEIQVTSTSPITVHLASGSQTLNEVVVTALGVKREKRSLAYAAQTVGGDELNKSGIGNPLAELQGKASGVTVINSAGDPGAGTYIRLRGVTSITGDNQPLMVVDGIPIDNSINNYDATSATPNVSGASSNLTGGTQPTNRGIDLNPNDIESISILKGPAATALWGIKAASGALIITTKKGTLGSQKMRVDVNSSVGWSEENRLPPLQNTFAQGSNGIYAGPTGNANRRTTWGPAIDTLAWDGNANVWDPHGNIVGQSDPSAKTPVAPYDRYKFFQTGMALNNNVAVSGGSANTSFRASLGNLHQTGISPKSQYNKTTFSLTGQAKLSDKLNASGSITYINSANDKVQQGSNTSGIMLGLLRTPPTFDNSFGLSNPEDDPRAYVITETGQQRNYRGGGASYDNPYWTVNRNPFDESLNRVIGNFQATYQFADWIGATWRFGGDVYSQDAKNFYDINSNAFPAGKGIINEYFNNQYNSDVTLNLKKTFNSDLNGSLLVGYNYFYNYSHSRNVVGDGLIVPTFFDISNALSYVSSEADGEKRTMAFYGEAQLSYRNMLFLDITGRRETSSTLPVDNRNFFYPSAGLTWVFTELPAFKDAGGVLSFGKARLSYAQVGKDAPVQGLKTYYSPSLIADGFTPGDFFPVNSNGVPIGGYQITSTISVIGNPELKPERTESYEAGVDLGFFKSRINFSGTYYYSKTNDAILTVPLAYTTGFASKLFNAGVITNQGVELTLNTTPIKTKDFSWDLNLNWSTNKNLVKELAPGVSKLLIAGFQNGEIDAFAGKPFGQIYGSVYVRANPGTLKNPNDLPGGPLLINDDPNDPGYGKPIVAAQNAIIGDVNPDWIGSVINSLNFKGFTLGFQIDVRQGGDIWNGTRGALSYFGTSKETSNRGSDATFSGMAGHLNAAGEVVHFDANGDEVSGAGTSGSITTKYDQYYWQNLGSSFIGPAESDVEEGSFVKLREASIGYSFPKTMLGKTFTNLSLTVFASNIILHTNYQGVDPETSLAGPANGQGLDYFNNPGAKTYGIRLNVGLQ